MAATPLCALSMVSFVYPHPRAVTALQNVNISIFPGEQVAICGPSGSGKSTLLALLGLLDMPSTGQYRFDGQSVADLDPNSRSSLRAHDIGFIFQSFHLLKGRTIVENVALSLLYSEPNKKNRFDRATELLVAVGLGERLNHHPAQLSGGEQQRTAIARALAPHPRLVLADEPTGNLDSATGQKILEVLAGTSAATGTTLVLVTHNADVAATQDRTITVRDGSVDDGDC